MGQEVVCFFIFSILGAIFGIVGIFLGFLFFLPMCIRSMDIASLFSLHKLYLGVSCCSCCCGSI